MMEHFTEIRTLREALGREGRGEARPQDWRIFWGWTRSADVGIKDSEPANVYSPLTMTEGLGARVLIQWADGKVSSLRAERAELEQPGPLLAHARAAAYEDPDSANFLGAQEAPPVPLFVAATADAASGAVEPFAALLAVAREKAALHGFRTASGSVSATHRRAGVITSRGCDLTAESTGFSYGFWFDGQPGDGWTRREVIPARIASERLAESCENAVRLKSNEEGFAGGTLPVLLHPRVAEGFFATYVLGNFSGERIWNRQSAFRIEQFRERALVFREDLTVRLEPLVPYGPGSYPFTSEGVPARRVDYIVSGKLAFPILDLKYARRFGMEPVPPPATIESLAVESCEEIPSEKALQEMGRGLLVLGILGLHTQDAASGDFSLSAGQSLAVRGGRLGGRVRAAISGNFFEILRSAGLRLVRFPGHHMPGILMVAPVLVEP